MACSCLLCFILLLCCAASCCLAVLLCTAAPSSTTLLSRLTLREQWLSWCCTHTTCRATGGAVRTAQRCSRPSTACSLSRCVRLCVWDVGGSRPFPAGAARHRTTACLHVPRVSLSAWSTFGVVALHTAACMLGEPVGACISWAVCRCCCLRRSSPVLC